MIIRFEGRDTEFDSTKIDVDEWRELKRKYKMTPRAWEDGIPEADPDALTFLYWLLLRRSGEQNAVLGDGLKFDMIALHTAVGKATEAEEAEQAAAKKAELEAAAAAAVPTRLGGPPSAEPPFPPDTTPVHPGWPVADQAPGSGSGTATLNGSEPSTSSPWPSTATSPTPPSDSSP